MIPPSPQRRKYLLDPNAHESRNGNKTSSCPWPEFWVLNDSLTSRKDNIRNSCCSSNLTSGNDRRFKAVGSLTFALDGFREWVVLEFFEQHFNLSVAAKNEFNYFKVIDENKKFSLFSHFLDAMPNQLPIWVWIIQSKIVKNASRHVTLTNKRRRRQNAFLAFRGHDEIFIFLWERRVRWKCDRQFSFLSSHRQDYLIKKFQRRKLWSHFRSSTSFVVFAQVLLEMRIQLARKTCGIEFSTLS